MPAIANLHLNQAKQKEHTMGGGPVLSSTRYASGRHTAHGHRQVTARLGAAVFLRRVSGLVPGTGRNEKGFTLVEVIVVLIILGILAAIAVPALTGYIDKARDRMQAAEARDVAIAMRTVLNEAYAMGELEKNTNGRSQDDSLFADGTLLTSGVKLWNVFNLSHAYYNKDSYLLLNRAYALLGERYVGTHDQPGYSIFYLMGSSTSTAASADGFLIWFYPEGDDKGKPVIVVTYRIKRVDIAEGSPSTPFWTKVATDGLYDPDAGYEVYHIVV
jgi:prepilin-type N-terminal cleavage/methylation domain-containing protein